MQIRQMRIDDLEQVLEIESTLYKTPWNKKHYLYELNENEFSHHFVLTNGNEIIGYYVFMLLFSEVNLTKLSIKKEYQGRGLAKLLLSDLLGQAKLLGSDKIYLEVRESNFKAISLYKSFDFVKTNTRKNYYEDSEDALILERVI